jgi:hypothetical protein
MLAVGHRGAAPPNAQGGCPCQGCVSVCLKMVGVRVPRGVGRSYLRPVMRSRNDERGTALMLIPAFVIISFFLASIVVDQMALLMQHRELADAAQAAANDAASVGVSVDRFNDPTAPVAVDEVAARRAVARALGARRDPLVSRADWDVSVVAGPGGGPAEIRVRIVADTHGVLFSFFDTTVTVEAFAETEVEQAP